MTILALCFLFGLFVGLVASRVATIKAIESMAAGLYYDGDVVRADVCRWVANTLRGRRRRELVEAERLAELMEKARSRNVG